jgi:hypothetical protein
MELDEDGNTHPLDTTAWNQRHRRLLELGGPLLP